VIGIVGFVGNEFLGRRGGGEQLRGTRDVGDIAPGQQQRVRSPLVVDQGVDFLPVVKGEKGGAVTPPERACLIRIRYGHRLWRRLLVGYFRPSRASRRARGRQDRFAPLSAVAFGQS